MNGKGSRTTLALASIVLVTALAGQAQASVSGSHPGVPVPPPQSPPLPLAPAHGTLPGWLHTSGTSIADAADHPVRLAAVNWNGFELSGLVPGGLDYRPYMSILRTIKYLGFNTIRLPFSGYLIERNPIILQHVRANPSFHGKHVLDILDSIIAGARQVGLMVILDDHREEPNASGPAFTRESVLWYHLPRYTQQGWINDWLMLARRYRGNPAVVGVDLHNEPHSDGPGLEILSLGYLRQGATWGPFQGVDNPATDWRDAAQTAGNAILRVNPHLLIVVEGTEVYPTRDPLPGSLCPYGIPATAHYCADLYWWGGNLIGAREFPVRLDIPHQMVYSPHEYGPGLHGQRWIRPNMSEAEWQQEIYKHWGYLLAVQGPNAAPVWVGEFGTLTGSDARRKSLGTNQRNWFSSLIHYLREHRNVGWAYWDLNIPQSGPLRTSSYGLLTYDWAHLTNASIMQTLRSVQT